MDFKLTTLILLSLVPSIAGFLSPADLSELARGTHGFLKLDFTNSRVNAKTASVSSKPNKKFPSGALIPENGSYDITLSFGSDQQNLTVALDTGSSDLWVPSAGATSGGYDNSTSTTYQSTGQPFVIHYVSGEASGTYVTDTVGLSNGFSLTNFQFGDVYSEQDSPQGILGISYESQEAISEGESEYPNFPVALKNAGYISKTAYSLFLNDEDATSGTVIFGGYDTEKYYGELATIDVVNPQNGLQANLDSITTPNGQPISVNAVAALDSGTTLAYLPGEIVSAIASDLGLDYDSKNGYIDIDCSASPKGNLTFTLSGNHITAPLSTFVLEVQQGQCVFGLLGSEVNSQGYNLLGDIFLRNAYVIYNLDENVFQIAQAKYTSASNIVTIS